MKALFRVSLVLAGVLVSLLALLSLVIWLRYGGGERFEDRTSEPLLSATNVETVIDLDLPPGNVAVSPDGRVFFTFHPEAFPETKVAEIVEGQPKPYPIF
jgi:hypothetical protein